jgi:hypothetical protein
MASSPLEITVELTPRERFDVIDVTDRLREEWGGLLGQFPRALYCSYHTTAGYLEQSLSARLNYSRELVGGFLGVFGRMFPAGAGYSHDRIDLRTELAEEQRLIEPRNADSHLAFIGAGLRNCVVYQDPANTPVYFVDLDGIHGSESRRRRTTVMAFHRRELVEHIRLAVPVSGHPIDSINLKDPRLGVFEQLEERIVRHGIAKGRIDIALDPGERHAGVTVNEYETLLMKHDLADVLRNPLHFMAEKGRHMLQDPGAIPGKTKDYAKYDVVRVVNNLLDAFGAGESLLESVIAKLLAFPASRFLGMRRSVSLLVSDREGDGRGSIVIGAYQSPILVQWRKADGRVRWLDATVTRLE